jgi:hypothetical protein
MQGADFGRLANSGAADPVLNGDGPQASTSKSDPSQEATRNGTASPTATRTFSSSNGYGSRPPSTSPSKVLSLKHPHDALVTGKSRKATGKKAVQHANLPLADAPPSNPQTAPAVSFSTALKPPPSAGVTEIHATEAPKVADPPPIEVVQTESSEHAPTDTVDETVEVKETTPRLSPTKSAMKPKSWADMLRGPTSPSAQKRVSIVLPPDSPVEPASDVFGSSPHKASLKKATPKPATLEEHLKGVEWQQTAPTLQPRGMINQGNMCFENSVSGPREVAFMPHRECRSSKSWSCVHLSTT